MKKLIALLLAVVMVMGLAACGSKTTTETKAPTEAKVDTPATEAKTDAPAAAGSVYYLNFKPEFDQALQGLAASYTEKTGVPVKVVTAASGDYSNTLNAQMGKDGAPTIYNIGNMSGLKDWDEYALDLTGTPLAGELTTNDFNLYNEAGELKAMGYCYETFGIIVNTKLLADAGHSLDEIKDFASLKAVADDIHARAAELGFDAFSSAGLCSGTENCWAINSQAKEEDIQASLDFLYWLVTDPDASAVVVEQLGGVPFKNCPASPNKFIVDGNDLMAKGNYAVTWAFNYTPNVDSWRATVVTALAAYSADPTDANWEAVKTAFVDGWAIEYKTVNG